MNIMLGSEYQIVEIANIVRQVNIYKAFLYVRLKEEGERSVSYEKCRKNV